MIISVLARRARNLCAAVVAGAVIAPSAFAALHIDTIHEKPLADFDAREAQSAVTPTAAQLAVVDSLGATARWNHFGTPQTVVRHGQFLATGLDADPVVAARDFLTTNAALFSVSAADIAAWEVYHVGEFAFSDAKAVKFRQVFDGLAAAAGGLVTVGVIDGKISMVTSSIVPIASNSAVPALSLTPSDAILAAAENAEMAGGSTGVALALSDLGTEGAWTTSNIPGLVGTQRAMTMAFPTLTGVRPVYETIVIDVQAGRARAYTSLVDAQTGDVLHRKNAVAQAGELHDSPSSVNTRSMKPRNSRAPVNFNFTGTYSPPPDAVPTGGTGDCGPVHGPYTTPGPTYQQIVLTVNDMVASNDIFVNLYFDDPNDIPDAGQVLVRSEDVGFGEAFIETPISIGDYFVEICPLANSINPTFVPPYTYQGTFSFDDSPTPSVNLDPRWRYFQANPPIDLSTVDTRELGCWNDTTGSCDFTVGNSAARGPWDFDFQANAPSNTTIGNQAITGEAWFSPLTPAEQYRPVTPTRDYSYSWTNAWNTSPIDGTGCSPANFTIGVGNDIDAAIANMFVAHNRMHDWSYYLGFTENNSNAQVENFGNAPPSGNPPVPRDNDPEIGNVQAGAVDGAFPAYLGRDNANQITLQDGVAPITNQYLWQALLGAIYVPCADGNYDMGIVGHEYGHMIQNRMTGGPAQTLSGEQGRRMGESWGDLTGMEYQNGFGVVPVAGESPFAIGAYVLGAPERGIRNYNMSTSPLNYSNIQYDPFGNGSPHADGEIWSAANFQLRELFIEQHDSAHPASDAAKQRLCAEGKFSPGECPGNRRWVQLMHDGFLLQPATPSYVDARDAQMMADVMRFAESASFGNHYDALWLAYARNGLGVGASSGSGNDLNPTASFELPANHSLANADVGFVVQAADGTPGPIQADIYIGHYEARANPIVTTSSTGTPVQALIAPGTYDMLARADGYGHFRFELTLTSGQTGTITVNMPTNYASAANGASASGEGAAHGSLIDDTEGSVWTYTGQVGNPTGDPLTTPVTDPATVTVVLPQATIVNRVQVSALAPNGGNRYENLRQFEVWGCLAGLFQCTDDSEFGLLYTSSLDAFNGQPIRPLAPNLLLQSFDLNTAATVTHVQLRALHNQCTGSTEFTRNDWATGAPIPDDVQDCRDGGHPILTEKDQKVTAAEFQVFGSVGSVDLPAADIDGDGVLDTQDNCVNTPNADQSDLDTDGVGDVCDNCLLVSNADQCNTNGNGTGAGEDNFGNVCDADLDNNGIVNSFDLSIMRDNFGASGANDSDLDCNGIVNSFDLTIMRDNFGGSPGPSGL